MTIKSIMRYLPVVMFALVTGGLWAQAPASSSPPPTSKAQDSSQTKQPTPRNPTLSPPRSERVDADSLPDTDGLSSSKDTQIDLSAPADDAAAHPKSADILMDEETAPGSTAVGEMHPWDPHKSAKDVEVGDYYFKRKNYAGAESRYREALYYKDNDALATYRLAVCLDKLERPDEARTEFENYLKILPNGPLAEDAKKEIARLKSAESAATKAAK